MHGQTPERSKPSSPKGVPAAVVVAKAAAAVRDYDDGIGEARLLAYIYISGVSWSLFDINEG